MKLIKNPPSKEVERQLLPRLRFMGYLLTFFGVSAFFYAFLSAPYLPLPKGENLISPEESEATSGIYISESPFFSLTDGDRTRFLGAAAVFAIVGITCIFTAKFRQHKLHD